MHASKTVPARNEEGPVQTRPFWLRGVDVLSVAAFVVAWGWVALRLISRASIPSLFWSALVAIPLAVILADFASGLVHWFADRYFDPRTRVLGPMLIEPFREHHRDPMAMTRHDFFEVCGNNGLVTLAVAAPILWIGAPPLHATTMVFLQIVAFWTAIAIFLTNQIHSWAHQPRPPHFIARLQARHVILNPTHHLAHHSQAHDRSYCVTTGWLNPWLDQAAVFPRLERGLARIGLHTAPDPHSGRNNP